MNSDIFDEIAIEAAAKAICSAKGWTNWENDLPMAKAALTAAVASLRERGMMRDGVAVEIGKNDWCAFTNTDGSSEVDMPVVIIRLPKETA